MWSHLFSFLLLLLLLLSNYLPIVQAQSKPLRILVTYKEDSFIDEALELAIDNRLNLNITSRNILSFNIKDTAVFQRIIDNPRVEFAEVDNVLIAQMWGQFIQRDIEVEFGITPSRDFEVEPYGISMVQADQLKRIPPVDDQIAVCVVDTGMNLGHSDLPTRVDNDVMGTNTESGSWFVDGAGHGTHCAGTIGAVGNNSIGVVGILSNPNLFRFHIAKGLRNDGTGFESATLDAVQGCIDNGARVVSMSLGGPSKSKTAEKFYRDVWDEGILLIAAAGNDGDSGNAYPASYKHVMSVAAVDVNQARPGFSQCNDQVEISAPGVDILSTIPGGYAFASGTSMACPHVAGVAAEVWSHFPDCSNSQIRNVLLRSSLPIGQVEGCNRGYGNGLVQAKAAYDLLVAEGCEAGGEADADPVGGCKQNPDYESNPNEKKCVSGGENILGSLGIVVWAVSSMCLGFLWDFMA